MMGEPLSFEVVGHQQVAVDQSLDLRDYSLLNAELPPSTPASPHCSLEQEEVQRRLVDLLEDNQAMKEALQTNNRMMKEQLSIISAWHSQMTTSMSRQQSSLREASEKVSELRREKDDLSLKVTEMEATSGQYSSHEVDELKKVNEMLSLRIKEIEKQNATEMNAAEQQMKELKKQNEMLSLRMKEIEATTDKCETSPDGFELMPGKEFKELSLMKSQLKEAQEELYKSISKHDSEAEKKEIELALFREKVSDAEKQAADLRQQLSSERSGHADTVRSLGSVQEDYDRVTKLLQIQYKDKKLEVEGTGAERRHQEEIDDLTARLLDLQLRLDDKEEQERVLANEIEALRKEAEQIPILKAQVEVYKDELQLPSPAPAEAAAAPEPVQSNSAEAPSGRHNRRRSSNRKGSDNSNPEMFVCPICNFGFKSLGACENHVNSCIEKS